MNSPSRCLLLVTFQILGAQIIAAQGVLCAQSAGATDPSPVGGPESRQADDDTGAERRFVVPERSADDLVQGIPASFAVEDIFRRLLGELVRHPADGPALLADFQQQVVDQGAGFAVDGSTYRRLEAARQRADAALGGYNPSGIPDLSVRDLREARELPGLGCAQKIQRKVIGELADLEIDALVGVIAVVIETYGRQVDQRAFWLYDRTQALAIELAERHHGETGDRDLFAAHLLAVADRQLKLDSYDGGLWALELFERVLTLRDDHPTARYWAGFLAEKYGRYSKAVRHFSALVEHSPGDAEARLRLAVNQARSGRRAEGEASLEALAHGEAPAWVRRVAWSELVRLVGDEDPERVLALLSEALEAFPDDSELRLQLAYHRRLDAWQETLGELERAIALGPEAEGPGGRVRYELARERGLIANRAWLAEQNLERRELTLATMDRLEMRWSNRVDPRRPVDACEDLRPKGGGS